MNDERLLPEAEKADIVDLLPDLQLWFWPTRVEHPSLSDELYALAVCAFDKLRLPAASQLLIASLTFDAAHVPSLLLLRSVSVFDPSCGQKGRDANTLYVLAQEAPIEPTKLFFAPWIGIDSEHRQNRAIAPAVLPFAIGTWLDYCCDDEVAAAALWTEASERGCPSADCSLGMTFEDEEPAKAFRYYSAAAAAGHANAVCNLGVCYELGIGVDQSPWEATACYKRAHDMGLARATCFLAECKASGSGCAADDRAALELLRRAASVGDARAMGLLGLALRGAHLGTDCDISESVRLLREAARWGDPKALLNLGVMLARGAGVAQDVREAVVALQRAHLEGDSLAELVLSTFTAR